MLVFVRRYCFFTAIGLLVALPGLVFAVQSSRYAVHVSTWGTTGEASEFVANLEGLGYSPLRVEPRTSGECWVLLGSFDYHIEAAFFADEMKQRGFPEVSVRSEEGASQSAATQVVSLPGFDGAPCDLDFVQSKAIAIPEGDPVLAEVSGVIDNQSTEEAMGRIRFLRANRTADDPVSGWLTQRLAYLHFRVGERDKALEEFQKIAHGTVAAPFDMRVEAANRLARLHQAQERKALAFQYFSMLANNLPEDSIQRSLILAEMTGIVFEDAKEGKGKWEDVRQFIGDSRSTIPDSHVKARALLQLMEGETYYYQKDYEPAIQILSGLVAGGEREEIRKEQGMALIFLGMAAYHGREDFEGAKAYLEECMAYDFQPADRWKHIPDMKAHAREWLAALAAREGRDVSSSLEDGSPSND